MSSRTIRLLGGWREAMAEHNASCTRNHPAVGMTNEELERIRQVLGKIAYRDWSLISSIDSTGVGRMQVYAIVPDSTTGQPVENRGRPVSLCPEMSDSFIVDFAFELIKEYEMHEAAERFSLGGPACTTPINQTASLSLRCQRCVAHRPCHRRLLLQLAGRRRWEGRAADGLETISRQRGPTIRVTGGSSDEVTPRTEKDSRHRSGSDDLARRDRHPAPSADRLQL